MAATQGFRNTKKITEPEDADLVKKAVHTQHQDFGEGLAKSLTGSAGLLHTATLKKQVVIPRTETVQVPVVRKEAVREKRTVVAKGQKLIPVTKYKEVEETHLQVKEVVVNGRKEKRNVPITKTRKIPYQEYEVKEVDVEVEVPWERVKTRTGMRTDKHVVSRVYDVEADHVYEMRPVLVKKGELRMEELHDHFKFKTLHGEPVWEDRLHDEWQPPPKTPDFRRDLHRPESASSIRAGTPLNGTMLAPSTYRPSRPGTGLSRASSVGSFRRKELGGGLQLTGESTMRRTNSSGGPSLL